MQQLRIGIDLGGTKIEGTVLDANGQEIIRLRVATPQNNYVQILDAINALVARLENSAGQGTLPVGMGIPGSLAVSSGLVRNANSICLNNQPLGRDINAKLGRDVRISNDANCLALSEYRDGAAQGAAVVFAVIIGTGTGGGIIVNGQLIEGAHGLGGEFGHVTLAGEVGDIPACYCGRFGCNETYLSGPAIVADFSRAGGQGAGQVQDIVELAKSGNGLAKEVLSRHAYRLGRALGTVVNILDPDVIVLGGGVSNLPGLVDNLPTLIAPHVFAPDRDGVRVTVKMAKWGDSSGVRGAAQLCEGLQ